MVLSSMPWSSRFVAVPRRNERSEEHTSELQSRLHLVCRLLLEKKKKKTFHKHARKAESRSSDTSNTFNLDDGNWCRYAVAYVSPTFQLLDCVSFILYPNSVEMQ